MTLTQSVVEKVICKLLRGKDYRIEVITLIDAKFLQFAIDFFKQVVTAKLQDADINADWYKRNFLSPELNKKDIAINSGLNEKTIHNMHNSSAKRIVIDASTRHYDELHSTIANLADAEPDMELSLSIGFKGVSVDLNLSESLIVINTLAVKRSALRGGLWSTAGKRVEKPLMQTFCMLYGVPNINYSVTNRGADQTEDFSREVDFYLINGSDESKCEVKLMGKGNPESADAVIARDSKVFVADKLSDTNKSQLDSLGVEWVELRSTNGFQKFKTVLTNLGIPHSDLSADIEGDLNRILESILS